MNPSHHYLAYFANPGVLWLLVLLPVIWALAFFTRRGRNRALGELGNWTVLRTLSSVQRRRRALRAVCFALGLIVLIVAAAGPRWGREGNPPLASGRDLVVVLDLSRSMLAEDVLPSRLGRAKGGLADLVTEAQKRGGHRLALVAFAGQARVVCPLTSDVDHFREALAHLDPDDPLLAPRPAADGPASGTRIGLGLRQAVELHDSRHRGHQDILLLSDGDDPVDDEEWQEGAAAAKAQAIPVHVIGMGNPDLDSSIPDKEGRPLVANGKEIRTRRQEKPLREVARISGGVYHGNDPPLDEWFHVAVQSRPARETTDDVLPVYRQYAAWFFSAAFGLFGLATVVSDRPRRNGKQQAPSETQGKQRLFFLRPPVFLSPRCYWLIPVTLALASAAPLQDPETLVRAGNEAFQNQDYQAALAFYVQAEVYYTDPGLLAINKAATLYRLGRFDEAAINYQHACEEAPPQRRPRLFFNLGNALFQQAKGQDVSLLDEAIRSYRECLGQGDIDPGLEEDSRHNLKLAEEARREARKNSSPTDDGRPPTEQHKVPRPDGQEERVSIREKAKGQPAQPETMQTSQRPPPGVGNLPPLPDENPLEPLSLEAARDHLHRAATRIIVERKKTLDRTAPPLPQNVRNW